MEKMTNVHMANLGSYQSKDSFSASSRNEKTTVYSEKTDATILNNNNDVSEPKDHKEEFTQKISEQMNERLNIYDSIMSEIKELYNGNVSYSSNGMNRLNLKNVAKGLFLNISKTISKKIRVLIIGNCSSGKSTFINWYIQEHVQKTGYEHETNQFTLITSGNYVSEFNGDVSVKSYEFLKTISQRNRNFKNNLCTKMYVSKNLETKNIDFIDTPGLRDIMPKMDYDINSIIYDLADFVDLILVFFDSSNKSLSNRLIVIIKEIYEKHMEKIMFVYSKIDEIRYEEDRIKLLCQTTQCLASKINIRSNIDLLPIYVYGAKTGTYLFEPGNYNSPDLCIVNRINDIIKEIKSLFFKKVQKDLYALNNDCDGIACKILEVLKMDNERRIHKSALQRERIKHTIIQLMVTVLFLFFLITQLSSNKNYKHLLFRYLNFRDSIFYMNYIKSTAIMFEKWDNSYIIVHIILLFFFFMSGIMKKKFSKNINVLHNTSKAILREQLAFVKFAKERGAYMTKAFYEMKTHH